MDWNAPGQVWSIHCDSRLRYVRWLTRVLLYRTSITGEETKWCTLLYMVAVWYDLNSSMSLLLLRLTWGVYRGLSVVQNWPTRINTWYGSHGKYALQWRHNVRDCVLNHQPRDYLHNHLIRRRSKKAWKLRATGVCAGNSPMTGELFPAQKPTNAEIASIWWCHRDQLRQRSLLSQPRSSATSGTELPF